MRSFNESKNLPWPSCAIDCSQFNLLGHCDPNCSFKFDNVHLIIPIKEICDNELLTHKQTYLDIRKNDYNFEFYLVTGNNYHYIQCIDKKIEKYLKKSNIILNIYFDYECNDYFKEVIIFDIGIYDDNNNEIYVMNLKIPYSEVKDYVKLNFELEAI